MIARALALVVALCCASAVLAQTSAALKREMVGQWELSNAERSKTCVVTLKGDAAPGGAKLELEKDCAAALPFTSGIVAWDVKGLDIVRLQDGGGQGVIDFTEVESGIFEGRRSGEGIYILQNLAAARAASRSMDQMIGNWSVVRGNGRGICGLTLTNTDAGDETFQVFVKPRCEAPVLGFLPKAWRLERGELLLLGASGAPWRFEADDNAQWRRIPDAADPMILVRQ